MKDRSHFFTFGNHMHWVDMEWMWGRGTLANSLEEMISFVEHTGAKGAINFDAVGYEYLATESPELITRLCHMISKKEIEVASGSYTQAYGHLCGEEANIMQFLRGLKICKRLLGTQPKLWWEEEFCFFPQLPQILEQLGYTTACLFFQETWHTPYVPQEQDAIVRWKGPDGSTIDTIAFTKNCIHQWPEHLEKKLLGNMRNRVVVQWLELLNSKKWMCRSELIEPVLARFIEQGYHFSFLLPSEIPQIAPPLRTCTYSLYDMFQGISLGKNGDELRRKTRVAENEILDGQMMASISNVMGLGSPQWSEYPDWEFFQAWTDLMISQAHDIDECEGFCGDVGKKYLEKAISASRDITSRYLNYMKGFAGNSGELLVFNPLHWERKEHVVDKTHEVIPLVIPAGPGFVVPKTISASGVDLESCDEGTSFVHNGLKLVVMADGSVKDERGSVINRLSSNGRATVALDRPEVTQLSDGLARIKTHIAVDSYECYQTMTVDSLKSYLEIKLEIIAPDKPIPGYRGALYSSVISTEKLTAIKSDYPFGQELGWPDLKVFRKYPRDDWMTSKKFYEFFEAPFTGLRFAEAIYETRAIAFLGNGTQGFFRTKGGFEASLFLYDPWDGDNWTKHVTVFYGLAFVSAEEEPEYMAHDFNRKIRVIRSCGGDEARAIVPVEISGEVFLSSMYIENGSLFLRLWNQFNKTIDALFKPNFEVKELETLNIDGGNPHKIQRENGTFRVSFKPFEIKTLAFSYVHQDSDSLDSYRRVWADSGITEVG